MISSGRPEARSALIAAATALRDPGPAQEPSAFDLLAEGALALGAERINIEDFELHHMSPERGGTLQVLVEGEGEAQRAAALLEGQGYSVVVSPVLEEQLPDE